MSTEKIKLEIPIAGVPEEIEIREIDIDKLILDQENPRIGYWRDNIMTYTDVTTQGDLEIALRAGLSDEYNRLKRSVETNEGIMKEIWVYPIDTDLFKIIDGNTRLLIYKDLRGKYPHKETYKRIRCRILPANIGEQGIDFIRLLAHLRGENEWQLYDRARILYILWEKGATEQELKNRTKLSWPDIKKLREAYKNMTQQFLPNYSHISNPFLKFSYFVEFENKKIKDGMGRHNLTIKDFCDWVGNDEIPRAQDVRDLRKIFEDDEIARILKDEGFQEAKYELSLTVPAYASRLFEHIEKCLIGLRKMTVEEERNILSGEESMKKAKIMELYDELTKFVEMIKKFED